MKRYRSFSLPLAGAVVGVMVAGTEPAERTRVLVELTLGGDGDRGDRARCV